MWILCVCEFELARAHVLDYALAQRADGIGTRPAIIVLSNAHRSRRKSAPASAGYRGSDLSEWPLPTLLRRSDRPREMAALQHVEKGSRRVYVFRIASDNCRKRAVPALTFIAKREPLHGGGDRTFLPGGASRIGGYENAATAGRLNVETARHRSRFRGTAQLRVRARATGGILPVRL
jgi:hypothetical protein